MAFTSVSTKVTTAWNSTEIVQVLSGGAGTGDAIFVNDLPMGSAHIVQTSGTAITNITLKAANDGVLGTQAIPVLTNAVTIGSAITSLPALVDMTANGAPGGNITGAPASMVPAKYFQWVTTGGDATSVVTITHVFMGTRG